MKQYILPSIKMTLAMLFVCVVAYSLLVTGIGKLSPGKGNGEKIIAGGRVVGYANIGQSFTADKYFWGRPSAVGYNAAGSGGSNKGPSNPDYLKIVQERIDDFLRRNPGIVVNDIPAELVTASGSGLDPQISPAAALVQVKRIARQRGLTETSLRQLIHDQTHPPLLGVFGPATVNVLQLNIALDALQQH